MRDLICRVPPFGPPEGERRRLVMCPNCKLVFGIYPSATAARCKGCGHRFEARPLEVTR